MDAKDILIEAAIDRGSDNDLSKFSEISTSVPSSNTKNYQDVSSLPLAKVDIPTSRPCAVIGPDRILPQPSKRVLHPRKTPYESWVATENVYRNPPEYPHKIATYQSPLRNISPRQTFQENMQRIMVPPTYNSMKIDDNINIILDRNTPQNKDNKPIGSIEPKYCDVPYSINPMNDNIKTTEMCVSDTNNTKNSAKNDALGWHPGSVNVQQNRSYTDYSIYDAPVYANCSSSRPVHISRPQGMSNEDSSNFYTEPYYQHTNFRFRPYPNIKEKYPQARYDYLNNFTHPYNPGPPFPPPKYDIQKHVPTHPTYPQVPLKYIDNRLNESITDGYQRPTPQINYNVPYQNQMIHPAYGPIANGLQNKLYSYTSDSSAKAIPPNKLPYNNNKFYYEYENIQNKHSVPESTFYINDMIRPQLKNQVIIPSYPAVNMHAIPPQFIRKENLSSKYYDYSSINPHVRHIDPSLNTNSHIARLTSQFSPNIAISPSDSNTCNDTLHAQTNYLEDCGYVGQCSNASMRSIDSNFNRMIPHDFHHRYNYQFPSMFRMPPVMSKSQLNPDRDVNSKDKKSIDIRQFLQMWNEGDEENAGNSKEVKKDTKKLPNQYDLKNQEQLYILGSVNVPNEELAKYNHIQKVSKLPDNIKGCNNVELLKQFEKVVESSQFNSFSNNKIPSTSFKQSLTSSTQPRTDLIPRSVSPLDVEAKISQSVIHKDVGCNFELRLCSPDMLNVEVATPIKNLLGERIIEKVTNPYQVSGDDLPNPAFGCNNINEAKTVNENKTASCNLINTQCGDTMKTDYTLQDLEFNSSVCLASLPRLDNDIELNFPEVNQQFINDNKDSDLTESDLLSKEKQFSESMDSQEVDVNLKTVQSKEQERVFAKLSKYRKNKKCEIESAGSQSKTFSKPIRTDSVIIKNPENSKCFDETEPLLSNNIVFENESTITNNLTVTYNSTESNKSKSNFDETPIEAAIDFSFNKPSSHAVENKNLDYIESSDSLNHLQQNISFNEEHEERPNLNKTESNTISTELYEVEKNNLPSKTLHENMTQDSIHENKLQEETANKHDNVCTHNNNINCDTSTEDKCSDPMLPILSSDTSVSGNFIEIPKNIFVQGEQVTISNNNISETVSQVGNNIKNETLNISNLNKIENNITINNYTEDVNHMSSKEPTESITNDFVNEMINKIENDINSANNTEDINHTSSKESTENIKSELINEDISQYSRKNRDNEICLKEANVDCYKPIQNSTPSTLLSNSSLVEHCIKNIKNNSTDESKLICENKNPNTVQEVPFKYSEVTNTKINDITSSTVSVSTVNQSLCLSNEKNTKRMDSNFFKKCNLKKELFSPWIQKLIWCNEDVSCSIKSSKNKNQDPFYNNALDTNSKTLKFKTKNEIITNDVEYDSMPENQRISTDSQQFSNENENFDESHKITSSAESFLSNPLDVTTNDDNILNETESVINNEQLLIASSIQETTCIDLPEVYKDNNLLIHNIICGRRLKRSLSDSDLCVKSEIPGNLEAESVIVSKKRKIDGCFINIHEQRKITETVTNDGHINRRNSISSPYNDEQLSFCIVIDNNCILNEETDDDMSFSSNAIDTVETNANIEPSAYSTICTEQSPQFSNSEYMEPFVLEISDTKSFEKSWVDDIGCVETVVSDNIMDEAITAPPSPIIDDLENNEIDIYNNGIDHRDKVKYIYGNKMCNHDAELLETLYRTPQMNVNKTLINKDSSDEAIDLKLSNKEENSFENKIKLIDYCESVNSDCINNKYSCLEDKDTIFDQRYETLDIVPAQDDTVNSCESSIDKVISYEEKILNPYHMPNSPEVSSTTPEEKSSAILLKITKHKGTRTSQLNNGVNISTNSCKFTENSNYAKDHNCTNPRPLLTKAAQKYIPPLRESLDLKVKLPLPHHSLLRLKQLKMSKLKHFNNSKREIIVKPKPKFEDVLKSIDEIQIKMHKEKTKKQKRPVPKLVIKKNENGSHYTSSPEKDHFNPDMTGRKWQPWVFIEKNNFIDRMAIKRKTKAIFSYRKNTFIFADKFQKYKSVSNTNFIISQPKTKDSPVGQLKYTIKLKHSYEG